MPINSMQLAKKWWGENVNERPVWRVEDLPESWYKDILISLKLGFEVRRDIVILGKPDTELSTLLHSYFWEIVSCVLKPYTPYAITGIAAIHLHLGDESIPSRLDVFTSSSSSRIDIYGVSLIALEKKPDLFQRSDIDVYLKQIKTKKNYALTIESPEGLLIRLRPQYLRDYPQVISGFLKAIDFDSKSLSELLLQKSQPITYLRLAALFEQVGKNSEAQVFRNVIKATLDYASPGKAQILKHSLPASIASPKQKSDPVYVTRFRDQLRVYAEHVDTYLKKIKLPHWDIKKLQTYAEKTKKYDTYHSSTIEGYRVTQEEIQALIEGRAVISTGSNREEIERKMALLGYLEAHKFVLQIIAENFSNQNSLTEFMIREIYAHLFSPSVEAGFVKKDLLIQYRNDAVYIRNSRFVPPNYLKVDDLMRCLVEEVNEIHSKATQAIIAHYGFVTVHPYFDGNGRVARFLMNYLLCQGGIPWITIRIEDRDKYFHALEIAQCDEDIGSFVELMGKYLQESQLF